VLEQPSQKFDQIAFTGFAVKLQ